MPTVTEDHVKAYLDLFGQDLHKKSEDTYESIFLRSARRVVAKDAAFVCGRVSAEMQKKCVYKVDNLGVVQESQCECAAGT